MVILLLILQTVTKRFLLKRKTLLVCSQETYDTRVTLRNTIRAVKREDYTTAILVNLMQASTVTPSVFSARCVSTQKGSTRNGTTKLKLLLFVTRTLVCINNVNFCHLRSQVDRNSRSAHHKTFNSTQKRIQPKPNPTLQALPTTPSPSPPE